MSDVGGSAGEGVNPPRCGYCDSGPLTRGFVDDTGQGTSGYARWIPGALERGLFGGPKKLGRMRVPIHAFRCESCGHLELFAFEDGG